MWKVKNSRMAMWAVKPILVVPVKSDKNRSFTRNSFGLLFERTWERWKVKDTEPNSLFVWMAFALLRESVCEVRTVSTSLIAQGKTPLELMPCTRPCGLQCGLYTTIRWQQFRSSSEHAGSGKVLVESWQCSVRILCSCGVHIVNGV